MYKFLIFLFISPYVLASSFLNVKEGFNRSDMPMDIRKSLWNAEGGPFSADAGYVANDGYFYWLFRGVSIGKFDLKNNKNIEGWSLFRWDQELKDEKVKAMYTLASEPDFAISYNYKPSENISNNDPVLGCLAHNPLRYGDLEQNGRNELALFLGFESQVLDIVLFSPKKEKIIFSVRSIFTDSTDFDYGKRFPYQYASNFNISKGYYPGTKTYAKIFIGEFDGHKDNPDIIVWRKHYTSLSNDSIEKGFKLDSENYQFYTLKNDEYYLEIATEIQIQTWLKDNNLTWKKGFPSKSECKGEEGKLIPEMHDPLLNDPDVLK